MLNVKLKFLYTKLLWDIQNKAIKRIRTATIETLCYERLLVQRHGLITAGKPVWDFGMCSVCS